MGFFSWNCCACNNEILNVYAATAVDNQWLADIVALIDASKVSDELLWNLEVVDNECLLAKGMYDGYGRIDGLDEEVSFIDMSAHAFRLFHEACWEACGSPSTLKDMLGYPVNDGAPNQGHFVEVSDYKDVVKPQFMLH